MVSTSRGRLAPFTLAVLLFAYGIFESTASDTEEAALSADNEAGAPSDVADDLDTSDASPGGLDTESILEKMKVFPSLGKHGASLLQLAEEGLGFSASKFELTQLVPKLVELQKSVHQHYVVTKGQGGYKPSALLKRIVSRKSQSKVLKSMKQIAPNTDDAELMQQLDFVTQMLHQLHTNPEHSMQDILKTVSGAMGLDLGEEDMAELNTHMSWATELVRKFLPMFSGSPKGQKAEEL